MGVPFEVEETKGFRQLFARRYLVRSGYCR